MQFVVYALDGPDGAGRRPALYPEHRAHLSDAARWDVEVLVSGPLVADDGATPIGSLFVFEAADRATVERFHQADPFAREAIWERIEIRAFVRKR